MAQAADHTAEPETPLAAGTAPGPAVITEAAPVPTAQTLPEAATGDDVKAVPEESDAAAQGPTAEAGTEKTAADDKPPERISGAFGILLGERFEPSMVAKVLAEQEQSYRGPDGAELKGSLLRVEPSQPDKRFQRYAVRTTDKGVVYAIEGDYQMEVEQAKGKQADRVKRARLVRSTCKDVVKTLAGELEVRFGKPRGQGWQGEWFSFRQISDTDNRSIRLYAHRCRSGMYSVIYTDEKVQRGTLPGKASTSPEAGTSPEASTPSTGSMPAKQEPGTESGSQTDARSTAKP